MRSMETNREARIGVLGGTFDPIHLGHLRVARAARSAHALSKVLLVPASTPPHKRGDLTDAPDRMAMARIAAAGDPGLEASDVEVRRGGVSFTVDTLEALARAMPGTEIFFIIGEDTISELPLWRDIGRIFELARIVAVNRPGPRRSFDPDLFPRIPREILDRCERDRVQMPPVPIASRDIRHAIAAGEEFDRWIPQEVADYIRMHHLYGYRKTTKEELQP
jgi:nicotinate-nucleotide adenylyltransferase